MNIENDNKPLWIEVDDAPSSINRAILDNIAELTTEEQEAIQDDEALYAIFEYGLELEKQGLLPEDISNKIFEKLTEVTPHLTPERNSYPPFDVSVKRGIGWGTVVYFDHTSRRTTSILTEDNDDESWE